MLSKAKKYISEKSSSLKEKAANAKDNISKAVKERYVSMKREAGREEPVYSLNKSRIAKDAGVVGGSAGAGALANEILDETPEDELLSELIAKQESGEPLTATEEKLLKLLTME